MAAPGDGQLFRSRDAQLYIGEGEESVLVQSGDFALVLVKNAVSQLAAVVAMVGALQWPVGRDCAVTRTRESIFSFSLPGPLCYTLVFRSGTSAADLQKLEQVLEEYATCSSTLQLPAAAGLEELDGSEQADKQVQISSVVSVSKMPGGDLSLEMQGRLQRAMRMSAIAKVFFKSLERGTISALNHVKPMDMATPASRTSSSNLALASVDAVAKVVQAVEMGGRTLLESASSAVASEAFSPQGSSPQLPQGLSGLICSGWTLNNYGLLMLYRFITASIALHSGASSTTSGSSRSGCSSSSEFRRLLSSSSSSSSLSSSKSSSHGQAGTDATSVAASPPAVARTGLSGPSDPPPPPLFTSCTPRVPRVSDMPPPSGPRPPIAPRALDSLDSSSIRIYRPRPTPATPSSTQPAVPPCLPRPQWYQPPQK